MVNKLNKRLKIGILSHEFLINIGANDFLKNIIRDNLKKELADSRTADEMLQFESKIDSLVLAAFDIYMECREKIFQLQANETKARTFSAFKRAGLVGDIPEVSSELK